MVGRPSGSKTRSCPAVSTRYPCRERKLCNWKPEAKKCVSWGSGKLYAGMYTKKDGSKVKMHRGAKGGKYYRSQNKRGKMMKVYPKI